MQLKKFRKYEANTSTDVILILVTAASSRIQLQGIRV